MPKMIASAVVSTVVSKLVGKAFGEDTPREIRPPSPAPVAEAPARGGQASRTAQKIAAVRARKRGGREEQQLTTLAQFGGGGTLG
jgi:hypothetical protein